MVERQSDLWRTEIFGSVLSRSSKFGVGLFLGMKFFGRNGKEQLSRIGLKNYTQGYCWRTGDLQGKKMVEGQSEQWRIIFVNLAHHA
jgi:hypothetical protein